MLISNFDYSLYAKGSDFQNRKKYDKKITNTYAHVHIISQVITKCYGIQQLV